MAERTQTRDNITPGLSAKADASSALELPLQPAAPGIDRQLLALRKIIAPLLTSVMEAQREEGVDAPPIEQIGPFRELLASTVALTRELQPLLNQGGADARIRWQAACGLTEIVAAHFRATAVPLDPVEGSAMLVALSEAMNGEITAQLPDITLSRRLDTLTQSFKSLAPAVAAVARFSFGRDSLQLIEEVARRLTQTVLTIAGRLAGENDPAVVLELPLYSTLLEVAGAFYLESHFAEMDRLLEMSPEVRNDYVQLHDKKIPMEPVWESLELKLAMLEIMAPHLPTSTPSAGHAL